MIHHLKISYVYNIHHFSSNVLSNLLWNSCISEPQIVCEQIFIATSCLSGPLLSEAIFWLPTKELSCLNYCFKSPCVTLTALMPVFRLFILLSFSSLDSAVCICASFSAYSIDSFPVWLIFLSSFFQMVPLSLTDNFHLSQCVFKINLHHALQACSLFSWTPLISAVLSALQLFNYSIIWHQYIMTYSHA